MMMNGVLDRLERGGDLPSERGSIVDRIGELLEQRESGQTEAVLEDQLRNSLKDICACNFQNIVIAYEPVWAIGTGKTATPEIAQETHKFVRSIIADMTDQKTADAQIILYGGSVKADNAAALFAEPDIDGGLIGGASLSATDFVSICQALPADTHC
jgi:triosephosphate isomerase